MVYGWFNVTENRWWGCNTDQGEPPETFEFIEDAESFQPVLDASERYEQSLGTPACEWEIRAYDPNDPENEQE